MDNIKNDIVSRVYQEKTTRGYNTTYTDTNESEVYKSLAHELIHKKLEQCQYIKSIKRVQLYNGYIRIIINYSYGRNIFTIKAN